MFHFKNSLFNLIIVTVSVLFIFLLIFWSKGCNFWGDDAWYSVYIGNEGIFDCLFDESHGGKYFGQFLDKFLSMGLPCFFGIHPENFISTWHAFFRALFIIITFLLMSKFVVIYEKSKSLYLLFYIFLIFFFISIMNIQENGLYPDIICVYYAYYRYCFSLLFVACFLYFIYKNITGPDENKSKMKLILVSICGYVIGTSSEIAFFGGCALIFLIIIWDSLLKRITTKYSGNVFLNSLKIRLNKNFYIPVLFFVTGVILFVSSQGFCQVATSRGISNINVTYDIFKEFTVCFFEKCVLSIQTFWISFILLYAIALYFSIRNKDLKPAVFSAIYVISLFMVMFSLLLLGKSSCVNNGAFWIEHNNILFLYKMLLIIPFGIILSYLYFCMNKNKKYLCVFYSFVILLFCFINIKLFFNNQIIDIYNFDRNWLYLRKQNNYITNKIARFYYINNETVILPIELLHQDFHFFDNLDPNTNCVFNENQLVSLYKRIYKETPNVSPYICVSDNAINEFYYKGGYITKEELNNLDFNRLFDESYVFKKLETVENEIYTAEEVNELIKRFSY